MSRQLEEKVISKLGRAAYDKFLGHFEAHEHEDTLVQIARKVSDNLGGKTQRMITNKKNDDWRSILRRFFMYWEQLYPSEEDEKELSTRRLVSILRDPDINLCSLAQDIENADDGGKQNNCQRILAAVKEMFDEDGRDGLIIKILHDIFNEMNSTVKNNMNKTMKESFDDINNLYQSYMKSSIIMNPIKEQLEEVASNCFNLSKVRDYIFSGYTFIDGQTDDDAFDKVKEQLNYVKKIRRRFAIMNIVAVYVRHLPKEKMKKKFEKIIEKLADDLENYQKLLDTEREVLRLKEHAKLLEATFMEKLEVQKKEKDRIQHELLRERMMRENLEKEQRAQREKKEEQVKERRQKEKYLEEELKWERQQKQNLEATLMEKLEIQKKEKDRIQQELLRERMIQEKKERENLKKEQRAQREKKEEQEKERRKKEKNLEEELKRERQEKQSREATLSSSYFLLENQLKEGYVLQSVDLDETPIMASRSEENLKLQLWKFDGNQLVANSNGLVLDIHAGTRRSRARVIMSSWNGGPSQQFKFLDNEIVSVRDGTVLDVKNGTKVRMYGRKGTSSQKWNQITSGDTFTSITDNLLMFNGKQLPLVIKESCTVKVTGSPRQTTIKAFAIGGGGGGYDSWRGGGGGSGWISTGNLQVQHGTEISVSIGRGGEVRQDGGEFRVGQLTAQGGKCGRVRRRRKWRRWGRQLTCWRWWLWWQGRRRWIVW